MGHLQSVEQEFRKLLTSAEPEALVRFVKEQVLASYRNGLAARKDAGATEPAAPEASKRRS